MEGMQQAYREAVLDSQGRGRVVFDSSCDSLELSDDGDDSKSSQAESDLSLCLSLDDCQVGNQHEDAHSAKNFDRNKKASYWQEQLWKATSHGNEGSGNQRKDGNQLDERSSDHSIHVESDSASVRDDSSLSLSKSSSSEADVPIQWLESEPSEPSDSGGDAVKAVLVSSDDKVGEIASSTSDAHWLSDSSSSCSSCYEPEWVKDQDEEQLWSAFDAALQAHKELNAFPITDVDQFQGFIADEDYDASVSASSLEGSDDESSDNMYERQVFRPRLSVGYDTSNGVDSLASLSPSSSGKTNSSVSSLDFQCSEHEFQPPNPLLDPPSSSCDEDPRTKGSRWIENIPADTHVSALGVIPTRGKIQNGLEKPRIWRPDEYVVAEGFAPHLRRGRGSTRVDARSVDSLSDDEEDVPTSPLLIARPVPHHKTMQHSSDLEETDAYVAYSDLAGIFERHAPRHDAVIIDLGCGTSRLCAELVFHGHRFVYGIDRDPVVIDFQRRYSVASNLKDFVQFLRMDITTSLAFPDEFSDFIVSKAVFDEIATRCLREKEPQELLQALKEAIRCLKHGGIFMMVAFQDDYVVDGDGQDQAVFTLDDATPVERATYRLESPWWRWVEVDSLLSRELVLVAKYELGCPIQRDGHKSNPYCALVWRRKESKIQRLHRVAHEIRVQKRMEREYDTRIQLLNARIQREAAEEKMVMETRQMILEDELSSLQRMIESQGKNLRQRIERRAAFYAALLENERETMTQEDAASAIQRAYQISVVKVVTDMISHIIEGIVVATAVAPAAIVPPQATPASLEPVRKARLPVDIETQARDNRWVREMVLTMVDAATAIATSKEIHKPVQRRRQAPTHAVDESTSDYLTMSEAVKDEHSTDSIEPRADAGPHAVAEHVVNWIVSHAIASIVQAPTSTVIPNSLDKPHVPPSSEIAASVVVQTPTPVLQAPHVVAGESVSSDAPPPEGAQQPSHDENLLNLTTADTTSEEDASEREGESVDRGEEGLRVCKAVLEAMVSQVTVAIV